MKNFDELIEEKMKKYVNEAMATPFTVGTPTTQQPTQPQVQQKPVAPEDQVIQTLQTLQNLYKQNPTLANNKKIQDFIVKTTGQPVQNQQTQPTTSV